RRVGLLRSDIGVLLWDRLEAVDAARVVGGLRARQEGDAAPRLALGPADGRRGQRVRQQQDDGHGGVARLAAHETPSRLPLIALATRPATSRCIPCRPVWYSATSTPISSRCATQSASWRMA